MGLDFKYPVFVAFSVDVDEFFRLFVAGTSLMFTSYVLEAFLIVCIVHNNCNCN